MNIVMHPVLFTIYNVLLFAMWCGTIALIFPRCRSNGIILAVHILALLLYFSLTLLPFLSSIRTLGGILAIGIPAFLLYEGKWYSKLLVIMMVLITMVAGELLIYFILPHGYLFSSPPFSTQLFIYLLSLFVNAGLLCMVVLVSRLIRRRHNSYEIAHASLLFMLFPLSQYAAFTGWFKPISPDATEMPLSYLLVLGLEILADIGLVYALAATTRSSELRAQNRLLQSQIRDQQEYYAALAEHYRNVRKMRHDIDNHLYTIQSLLEDGKQDDAARYAGQLAKAQQAERPVLGGCENTVAASFLLHRQKELAEKGIRLNCSLTLPAQPGLDEIDLICALGNMLDNAEEACVALPDDHTAGSPDAAEFDREASPMPLGVSNDDLLRKTINLSIESRAPYLSLKMENPCSPTSLKNGNRRNARRIPELDRGVGQTILQQLAEKYDGEFHTAVKENRYIASLIMKLPSKKE